MLKSFRSFSEFVSWTMYTKFYRIQMMTTNFDARSWKTLTISLYDSAKILYLDLEVIKIKNFHLTFIWWYLISPMCHNDIWLAITLISPMCPNDIWLAITLLNLYLIMSTFITKFVSHLSLQFISTSIPPCCWNLEVFIHVRRKWVNDNLFRL